MHITSSLINWYSTHKRNLPWRDTKLPYFIWLSEIIMQQTQIKQGLPYYKSFTAQYPTVFQLANAQEDEILKLWQGLGYYSRARNLHHAAKYVVNECNGKFPDNYKDLLNLKGVGDYTASAIASICFNEPVAVVDGNVYRVLSRYFGIDTAINSSEGIKVFKEKAQEILDVKHPGDFNQAVMEFGAMQCKPKSPNCSVCVLNKTCSAYNTNKVGELPFKLKAKKPRKRYFNFLVFISDENETVLEQRTGKGIWENLYQFPLIETKELLSYKECKHIINDHTYIKGYDFDLALYNSVDIVHKLSHQHLYTKFWIIKTATFNAKGIPIQHINSYAVPVLIDNFIKSFKF